MAKTQFLLMAIMSLALTQQAQVGLAQEEEVSTICSTALDRFVEFMEVEAGHDHEEEDHEDHEEEELDDEHILEALTCNATEGTYSVLFEGEEYSGLLINEYQYDGCSATEVANICEMLICEGADLHLVQYDMCCSEVTDADDFVEECHIEVEASESTVVVNGAVWGKTIAAVFITAFASLIGAVFLLGRAHKLDQEILNDVSALAIGFLLSTVFVHLMPEAAESIDFDWKLGTALLGGICTALFIHMGSSMLGIGHTHSPTDLHEDADAEGGTNRVDASDVDKHHSHGHEVDWPLISNIIIGDGIHNLVDGMILGIAFSACPSSPIGWITLAAVLAHELPQELVDFMVLVRAGLSYQKALFFNFCSSLTAVLGAIIVLSLNASISESAQAYLLAYGTGFLAYVALGELAPSIVEVGSKKRRAFRMFLIVVGAVIIGVLGLFHEHCDAGGDHEGHNH